MNLAFKEPVSGSDTALREKVLPCRLGATCRAGAKSVNAAALGRTDRHNSSREFVKVIPKPSVYGYAVIHHLVLVIAFLP